MEFGALIIGDEIMRGKRTDGHFAKAVELLQARGLNLAWCVYVGDDRRRLVDAFRNAFACGDVVFSFGGIGATPDDHTRQACAEALGVPLELHADAEAEIRARCAETGMEPTPLRLSLGEYPRGARIIPNPYNRMPGFSVGDVHCFPGFPVMAWPMLEWVLDTHYRECFHAVAEAEHAVIVWEGLEGQLIDLMRRIEAEHAGVTVFSLPSFGGEGLRRHIELGVRGTPDAAEQAMAVMRSELDARRYEWEPVGQKKPRHQGRG
jgi:molybdopterin-biosynthesis enzyme MoeA-like protein